MQTEIIATLISSIIGGLLVAVANHLFTRKKTDAEIEKLRAETRKITAETDKLRGEMMQLNTASGEANYYAPTIANERVIYDGTHGINGHDISSQYQYTIQQGVLVIQDSEAGLALRKYVYDGKESEFIPKNEVIAGERRFRISCELKVIKASYAINFYLQDYLEEEDGLDDRRVTITHAEWKKTDLYFRVRSDVDCLVHIWAERLSETGSLQIRNLVLAERVS